MTRKILQHEEPPATPDSFGQELRRLRRLRGLAPKQLAERVAVTPSVLHKIEWGQRYPLPGVLGRMATALDCDAERLGQLCLRSKQAAAAEARKARFELAPADDEEPTDPRLRFGWRIAQARRRKGLSQTDLGRRCGFSSGFIRQVELGACLPGEHLLGVLAVELDLSKSDLQRLRGQGRVVKDAVSRRVHQLRAGLSLPNSNGQGT